MKLINTLRERKNWFLIRVNHSFFLLVGVTITLIFVVVEIILFVLDLLKVAGVICFIEGFIAFLLYGCLSNAKTYLRVDASRRQFTYITQEVFYWKKNIKLNTTLMFFKF